MSTPSSGRSVKIDQDERGGWSSDRPRRDGAPPRPADLNVRSRVLAPTALVRYSPGSLLLIACPSPADGAAFADRLIEERGALLSLARLRKLIAGRVPEEELEAKAADLLDATVRKRLTSNESVVVNLDTLEREERERHVRVASGLRRPCHLILLEVGRDEVSDDDRPALNALRKALDGGKLGAEGFGTALRLSPGSVGEVKRIAFRPPPSDD